MESIVKAITTTFIVIASIVTAYFVITCAVTLIEQLK